jgi:hypothetical protein
MEIRVIVHQGQIRLPTSVDVPDGTEVRVVVDDELLARHAEQEPLDESEVMDDLRWTTGLRFSS